jgi:hypothetical protein
MAVPSSLHGSEAWTFKKQNQNSIQAEELKFLGSVEQITRSDKIKNEDKVTVNLCLYLNTTP